MAIQEGDLLWRASQEQVQGSRLADFLRWLEEKKGLRFGDYASLWQWSVTETEAFWRAMWDFFGIEADGSPERVLEAPTMPGANWFPATQLNYTEHIFRNRTTAHPALIARSETQPVRIISWDEMERATGAMAATLRAMGVGKGDRVASYMPNIPETVIAFFACASIGAIWSSCSPDMGVSVVLDRFSQIEPKVLFAVDSYNYNGKMFDKRAQVTELLAALPSIRNVVHVSGPGAAASPVGWPHCMSWQDATAKPEPLQFTRVPFSHPLWIVYSSGTTGLPKAMVHGHGGVVLAHLKIHQLQHDVRPTDRFMFLGSTGWIVWNFMVGALLSGSAIVLYDGNPTWPNEAATWQFMADHQVTHFGCGAAFLSHCLKNGLEPHRYNLSALRSINSTGSPLPLDAYQWVYEKVKPDIWLASISGGTDIAGGFVGCAPNLPVNAGEIQCAELGVAAYAFNDAGQPVLDEVGELVITKPMPNMPLYFWNDKNHERYLAAYFEQYPGKWRHGDWIRFTSRGSAVIYGRSDSTINRYGIRMGTAEIYRVVEELPEVRDSMVVDLEYLGRPSYMPLFVVPADGVTLDEALQAKIKEQIRKKASARHVPNEVVAVPEIPRTLTGKKMEVPVRKLLLGTPAEKVASPDAMANPGCFAFYVEFAKGLEEKLKAL